MVSEIRLWSYLTQESVYNFYMGELQVGYNSNSPFRDDPKPSFRLDYNQEGFIFWKDFGLPYEDDIHDSIGFVSRLYKLNRKESVLKIWREMVMDKKVVIQTQIPRIRKTKIPYTFTKGEINKEAFEFWDGQCISRSVLQRCNIHLLKGLYKLDYKILESQKLDPAFLYLYNNKPSAFKTYAPYNKDFKFRGQNNGDRLECEDSLQIGARDLIIGSSTKDSATIISCGINSCSPTSENSFKALLSRARELNSRFTNVWVLFDRDNAGILATQKLIQITGWKPIWWKYSKDPSDFVKDTGDLFLTKVFLGRYLDTHRRTKT